VIAGVVLVILLWMSITGVVYRALRNVFHVEKEKVHILMALHTFNGKEILEWLLGDSSPSTTSIWMNLINGSSYIPIIFGFLTIFMIFTGMSMTLTRYCNSGRLSMTTMTPLNSYWSARTLHRWVTLLLVLPLSCTAMTGIMWTVLHYWLRYRKEQTSPLLQIHQGSIFIDPVIYTVSLAVLVIATISAAIPLLPMVRMYSSRELSLNTTGNKKRSSALERTRYTLINAQNDSLSEGSEDEDDGNA
jgi:hypothetical protein